jgi:soluble lytic murein transglycosylase
MYGNYQHIRIPTSLFAIIFITVTVYAGGSAYWILKKDNEVEKFRRMEIELQNQIKERDLYLQQNRQQIEQLEKRFEILNAVRQLSSADVSRDDQLIIAAAVDQESHKYGHNPFLLLALMATESSLRPWATSEQGAHGLMQLMPKTGKALAERVLDDPKLLGLANIDGLILPDYRDIQGNIQLGTLYFTNLLLKYNDLEKAICAYNLGPNLFQKRLEEGGPMPKKYANKVIDTYRQLVQGQKERDVPFTELVAAYPHTKLLAQADNPDYLP